MEKRIIFYIICEQVVLLLDLHTYSHIQDATLGKVAMSSQVENCVCHGGSAFRRFNLWLSLDVIKAVDLIYDEILGAY